MDCIYGYIYQAVDSICLGLSDHTFAAPATGHTQYTYKAPKGRKAQGKHACSMLREHKQCVHHLVLGFPNADLEELVLEQLSSSGPCFWVLVQALAHHLP